jgi:putative ABC transport system permease protein
MTWWQRLRNRDRLERELDAELRYHFDRQVEENIRAGMSEPEARRLARLEFGGDDQLKERCRDARGTRWVLDIGQDSTFAIRLLAKERWFSAASILALALGIGVTTMVVTIINGYNFRGLPVDDPERLLYIGTRDLSGRDGGVSYPDYQAWRTARSFEATGAFADAVMTIGDQGQFPESLRGAYVSQDVFGILGETPILGRSFRIDDDRPGAAPVVILGHRLWVTRYEAEVAVIGRSVMVNGVPAMVIGVMREGFEFPFREGLWQPLALLPGLETQARDERVLGVVGRLANDVGADLARAELSAIAANIAREFPNTNNPIQPVLARFGVQQVGRLGDQQPPLVALATAMFVLLIACANVANLLLARSAGRAREIAIRASVGATRSRIVRQLLVESLLLSLVAGALGIWLSRFGVRFVAEAFGRNVPYWMHFPVDGQVLAIVVILCVFCTLVFGILPALAASRTDFGGLMKEGGRTGVAPRVRRWTQALLVAEVAVTFTLLADAGLMLRSVLALYRADQVIDASRVLTAEIALPEAKYGSPAQRAAFYQQLDDRLSRSGLTAASIASTRPFTGGSRQRVSLLERPAVARTSQQLVVVIAVGPRYFDALRVPVLRGRYFSSVDGTPGHHTAVVNQRFVELFYPNEDPVGRLIRLGDENTEATTAPWLTIVGVSPTIRQSIAAGTRPVVYLPLASHVGTRASIIVGDLSDQTGITPLLRREVGSADRDVTLFNVRPLSDLLDDSRLQPRLLGTLVTAFASIALLLSVVGLYAFTAYGVQQRTHEIGVRMALGAQSGEVVLLFLRRGMLPLGIGVIIGLVGAFGVGKLLQGLLIQTSPTDPVTLVCILVLLAAVSIVACLLPARKAANLDPLTVLRYE